MKGVILQHACKLHTIVCPSHVSTAAVSGGTSAEELRAQALALSPRQWTVSYHTVSKLRQNQPQGPQQHLQGHGGRHTSVCDLPQLLKPPGATLKAGGGLTG